MSDNLKAIKDGSSLVKKERNLSVDIVRGLCIILMVLGHVGFGYYFDYYIHAFHVPVFFVITGMFFKSNQPFLKFAVKKLKTLIVPYVLVGVISLIIWKAINYDQWSNWAPAYHLLWDNSTGLPYNGALWFLTAMFWTTLLYWLLDYSIRKPWLRAVVVCLLFVAGLFQIYLPFRLPWQMGVAPFAVLFVEAGRWLKIILPKIKFDKMRAIWKILLWLVVFGIESFLICVNGYVNVRTGTYAIFPLTIFNVVLMTVLLLKFAEKLEKMSSKVFVLATRYFSEIGKDSIIYLCFNEIIIRLLDLVFGANFDAVKELLIKVLILIITMIAIRLLKILIKKKKNNF